MTILIDTEHGTKPRYLSTNVVKDFVGNLFFAVIYYDDENGYDGESRLFKLRPDGVKTLLGSRKMTRAKGDSVGICLSGADILVAMSGHVNDPDTDLELLGAYLGVASPYPEGVQPGHGGLPGYTEGGTGLTDADWIRLQTMLDAQKAAEVHDSTAALVAAFGGNVRNGIHDKVMDALVDLWKKDSTDPTAQAFQLRFDQDVRDRAYEALVSYGAAKKP